MPSQSASQFLNQICKDPEWGSRVAASRVIPASEASYLEPEQPLPPRLTELLKQRGLGKLYRHQALALNAVRAGRHSCVVTPTASGKTLISLLPVLEKLLQDPSRKSLFVYPIKALAQDQKTVFDAWLSQLFINSKAPQAAIYDGDTSAYQRLKLRREPAALTLTNPDMLHLSFLPHHSSWGKLLGQLTYVVIDEAHSYRGVFGAHVAMAIRRLRRLCRFYGSDPTFIFLSATIANPGEFCERLLGEKVEVISENGAPSGEKHLALWNPEGSPYREATDLFIRLLGAGFKSIAFTKARKITELMARWAWEAKPALRQSVAAYRAGYLPEERREIEARLFGGQLDGVISTSALELGIDVGGLDACLLVGFPGTMISARQRMGRVGRQGQSSVVFLIGLNDALDQYFMAHPESFFDRVTERALLPTDNLVVLERHYACAAAELPLGPGDERELGPHWQARAKDFWRRGLLRQDTQGAYHATGKRPERDVNLRGSGASFRIEVQVAGATASRWLGTLEVPRVYRDGHEGAIYLHQGAQYQVQSLDLGRQLVKVREVDVDYYTEARGLDEIEILEVTQRLDLGHLEWCFGRVRAREQVTGYVTKHMSSQKILSEHELEMPMHEFETRAAWWVLPVEWRKELALLGFDFAGAIHALEHAQIALLPVFASCDRWDLGGVSYWNQPQLDKPVIFVYDGHAGGAALAETGFAVPQEWLAAVEDLLVQCPCEDGCPACVQSPKCGNGNKPLDKKGALELTQRLRKRIQGYAPPSPLPSEAGERGRGPINLEGEGVRSEVEVSYQEFVGARSSAPEGKGELKNILFFDLETQYLAAEVGGWDNKDKMKVSVAVTYSAAEQRFYQYTEGQVEALGVQLLKADLVVGFNSRNFDYEVLRPYLGDSVDKIKTLDMIEEVTKSLGRRLSLDSLAKATLNSPKSADGLKAVEWWREGRLGDLLAYCQKDVEITRDLYEFGKKYGYLLYEDRQQGLSRLAVSW